VWVESGDRDVIGGGDPPPPRAEALSEGTLDSADFFGFLSTCIGDTRMPFATNAPSIKDMIAALDAGTATHDEVAKVAATRFAREGKSDAWYARYAALVERCDAGETVTVADCFPTKEPKAAAPAKAAPVGDASWKSATEALLAVAPSASSAQVAAFVSKLIRAAS